MRNPCLQVWLESTCTNDRRAGVGVGWGAAVFAGWEAGEWAGRRAGQQPGKPRGDGAALAGLLLERLLAG